MSFSFKKFLSTIGKKPEEIETGEEFTESNRPSHLPSHLVPAPVVSDIPVEQEVTSMDERIPLNVNDDLAGGFAPISVKEMLESHGKQLDPLGAAKADALKQITAVLEGQSLNQPVNFKDGQFKPETNTRSGDSPAKSSTPLVYSKAEDFIAATLTNLSLAVAESSKKGVDPGSKALLIPQQLVDEPSDQNLGESQTQMDQGTRETTESPMNEEPVDKTGIKVKGTISDQDIMAFNQKLKAIEFDSNITKERKLADEIIFDEKNVSDDESPPPAYGIKPISEAEYVYKALSKVPPDMRYQMIPSLVKNLALKTYGNVRVSDCLSSPIMSIKCEPSLTTVEREIENAAAKVLEATIKDPEVKTEASTNIPGLVNTVLSLTDVIKKIEDNPTSVTDNMEVIQEFKSALNMPCSLEVKKLEELENRKQAKDQADSKEKRSDAKVWRSEGMESKGADSSKTVFMSQKLNKAYEKAETKVKLPSYHLHTSKISREISYFTKILVKVGGDMRNTEYSPDPNVVTTLRKEIKEKLERFKRDIDLFVSDTLEGEIREKPVVEEVKREAAVSVEYVYPPEKKTGKEQSVEFTDKAKMLHRCTDCKKDIKVASGESVESALEKHAQSEEHTGIPAAAEKTVRREAEKKEVKFKDAKLKRMLMLNKVVPCLIDEALVSCMPCGTNIEPASVLDHVDSNKHIENLNNYNIRIQKDLLIQNPDIFGVGKTFDLNDLHIIINKIFVDPMSKYSYCGLCRKEVPLKQQNIEEHISSKGHEKLLLESLEGQHIVANGKVIPNVNVKTANMLDLANSPQQIDVVELERMLDKQQQRRSSLLQQERRASLNKETENADALYSVTTPDGKYVCLLCDVRGITSHQNLVSHLSGSIHKSNSELAKRNRGGLDPEQQMLFVKNNISVTYGRLPLIFECFACNSKSFAGLQAAIDHIQSNKHTSFMNKLIPLPKQPLIQHASSPSSAADQNKQQPKTSVVLHKNGKSFWCIVCRSELYDISSAYEHVNLAGHVMSSVDGVLFLQGTQFFCEHCNVHINGEKNVGQHIASPKHKSYVNIANAARAKQQFCKSNAVKVPSLTRAQIKKNKDDKSSSGSPLQKGVDIWFSSLQKDTFQMNKISEMPNKLYQCNICGTPQMSSQDIYLHIFSYEHVSMMKTIGASG